MKTNIMYVFVVCALFVISGCGTMFGQSYSRTRNVDGRPVYSEKSNEGFGARDTQIVENYSTTNGGYGYGMGGQVVGMPGTYVQIPVAPRSHICKEGEGCDTIPFVENKTARELENQRRAIQNLRDIERCRQSGKCR